MGEDTNEHVMEAELWTAVHDHQILVGEALAVSMTHFQSYYDIPSTIHFPSIELLYWKYSDTFYGHFLPLYPGIYPFAIKEFFHRVPASYSTSPTTPYFRHISILPSSPFPPSLLTYSCHRLHLDLEGCWCHARHQRVHQRPKTPKICQRW